MAVRVDNVTSLKPTRYVLDEFSRRWFTHLLMLCLGIFPEAINARKAGSHLRSNQRLQDLRLVAVT